MFLAVKGAVSLGATIGIVFRTTTSSEAIVRNLRRTPPESAANVIGGAISADDTKLVSDAAPQEAAAGPPPDDAPPNPSGPIMIRSRAMTHREPVGAPSASTERRLGEPPILCAQNAAAAIAHG